MSRLQKLVSMLGSEQPGEAEAARRKLMEHLGTHRLSLTDVAMRLRDGGRAAAPLNTASFTQGSRELSLERQLSIARSAKLEVESELRRAQMQVTSLQQALQQAAFDVGRALRGQAQARLLAACGWAAAAITAVMLLLLSASMPVQQLIHPRSAQHAAAALRAEPELGESVMRLSPGEHYGIVLIQDLPVRLTPNEDAGVRAFLNRGMRVVIEQQAHVGMQSWLLIRSVTGSGWVRGGDVLH